MIKYFSGDTNNDRWIIDVYKNKRKGFFIEAGAFNGIDGSSTYTLEKYFGWTGILLEPGNLFEGLKKNRKKSICVNLCLSDKNGSVLFVDSKVPGYSGIKENLIIEEKKKLERWGKPKDEWRKDGYTEKHIEAITFYNLLINNNAPKVIDYVAFDMEGSEYNTLNSFPFHEYKILAFSIEGDSCNELLMSNGYRQVRNRFNTKAPWENYFLHQEFHA